MSKDATDTRQQILNAALKRFANAGFRPFEDAAR